jgi:hypothetical protein
MKDFKIIEIMELFDEDEITTADKIDRPERALEREAIDDFMKRNPQADGGRTGFAKGPPKEMVDELEQIKLKTEPLTAKEKKTLFKSYDDLFRQEYKRLVSIGDPFSKIDLNRAVINRIVTENPTISLKEGIGLDKIPGGGNEESKTLFERYDKTSARGPIFTKKELKNFTQGNKVFARVNTKTQENLFKAILQGNTDKTQLAKELGISEGRLSYNVEKLMRNLVKSGGDQYVFLNDFKEKDLEKVRNNIYESPTLETAYQRTILQSVYASTELGSKERKQALNKLKEFNKFKKVMVDNGIDPKLLSLDHAASYRAIKNGNIKTFLSVTPVIRDINALKSTFDKRSQLNLRRMRDYLLAGDTQNYKYFLKNQTELENLWKTMTGGQSSLGKIRVTTKGPNVGNIKIFDYGATSLLDKNKNLLNELSDNLKIRQNIVNASSVKNLDEARRIMLEGSELTEKKMLGTFSSTDRAARTQIDKSFKKIDDPKMFKAEKQIEKLLASFSANPKCRANLSRGGRINYANGPASLSECAISGKNRLEKVIKTGAKLGPQEGALATQILKAGRSLGSAFTLSGLFGPAALAFTAAAEAGIVGYDMLTTGKTFKETIGDSLLNYALGEKTKIDPNKELLKRFGTLPGMTDDKLAGIKNVLDQTNTLNTILKQDLKVGNLAEEVKAFREQPKNQFMIADDEMLQTDAAIRAEQKLKDEQKNLENLLINYRSQPPVGLNMEDTILGDMASGKFQDTKQDLDEAVKAAEIQKLESKGPVFMGKVFPKFEEGRQEKLLNLRAVDNPAVAFSQENQFMYPFGLAGGGIAGLSGGIDEGPQTVSMNPDSQGLRSLKKRVKNI